MTKIFLVFVCAVMFAMGYLHGFMNGVIQEREDVARRSVQLPSGTLVFNQ